MSLDIVVFALVAAFLVHRLRSVLGTRHGEERQRPNPFASADNPDAVDETSSNMTSKAHEDDLDLIEQAVQEPAKKLDIQQVVNDGLIENDEKLTKALAEITAADASFDVYHFASGARDVFDIVLQSYAEGDLDTLESLLSQNLYQDFEKAVRDREKKGHSLELAINDIEAMKILEARLAGTMVYITVDYDVRQKQVLRDAKGEILKGKGTRANKIHDVWTFARDVRSVDPSWMLIETRAA